MKRSVATAVVWGMLVVPLVSGGWATCTAGETSPLAFLDAQVEGPLSFELKLESASLKDGVALKGRVINNGDSPCTLKVCNDLSLCCVMGIYPVIGCDETGLALRNWSKGKEAEPTDFVLEKGKAFDFNITIPSDHLPTVVQKVGKHFCVRLCYAPKEGTVTHSPIVHAVLTE